MKYLYLNNSGKLTLIGRAKSYKSIAEGSHVIIFWSETRRDVEMDTDRSENSMYLSPKTDLLVLDHLIKTKKA